MALLPWDDEENKDDSLKSQAIKQITSVQGGSWQPAPSGANSAVATNDVTQSEPQKGGIFGQTPVQQPQQDTSPNYLMSEDHAQADDAKVKRDAEIEAARQEQAQARQRAEAAAEISQQFGEGNVNDRNGQKLDVNALKNDTGWKKYYDKAFQQEKDGLDFWGRLMDGGQASKRAEVNARNRYASELISKAYDENGNIIDPNAASYAKKVTAYNKALAEDNSTRSEALARSIGATKDNEGGGFWGRLKDAINAEKQMSIYDAIVGADDSQNKNANDVGRFVAGLGQGIFTMPVIGGKELTESARGRGTNYETGFEENLTPAERAGRTVSGALNVVTPFVGGSGRLLDSLTTKVLKDTATEAEKTLLKQLTAKILLPAAEQGGIGAAQSGAEYFGNGGTLLDENGDFDKEKLARFAQQVGEAGALSAAGGAVLAGAGEGVRAVRRNRMPTLDAGELAALETNATNSGEAQISNNAAANADGAALQSLENGDVTPVADGVVTPESPAVDTATPVSEGTATSQNADVTPVNAPVNTPDVLTGDVTPADGIVQTTPSDVTPVVDVPKVEQPSPIDASPATTDTPVVPQPVDAQVKPVSDGTVQPDSVVPVTDSKTPVAPTEEIRALQEAKAGKSQAQEAAINQKIQELKSQTPSYFDDKTEISQINRILENKDTVAGGEKIGDYYRRAKGEDWHVVEMTPDEYLARAAKAMGQDPSTWVGAHTGDTNKYASDMANGDKFPMPWINEVVGSQEGRTRALAAKKNGVKTMKVAIATKYNPEAYAQRIADEANIAHNQRMLDILNGNKTSSEKPINANNKNPNTEKPVPEDVTPVKEDSVPTMEQPSDGTLTTQQVVERLMPKLADNSDMKARIAEAAGMGKDTAAPVEEILRDSGVNQKRAERITNHFNDLEEQVHAYNKLEEANQKAYAEGGTEALDPNTSRERSRIARDMGKTTRRLIQEIRRMEGSRDHKVALMNGVSDIIGTRNANVLTSMGLLERNLFQELTANAKLAMKNPIKMIRSTFGNGNIAKDTAKSELSHWADRPSANPIEIMKYIIGNTYRTGMTPTTILANTRRGAIRDELTRWAFQELEGRKVSLSEAHKLAGTAGNEMEALVNTVAGVDNGMTNRGQAKQAIDAWKEYIRTGDDAAKAEFLKHVDEHTSLADKMIAGLGKDDQIRARGLKAMGQLIFPFVRTATNLTKNAFQQDLNPFAKSLLDEIKADQISKGGNAINLIKSKLVDYGIMSGAAALASSGTLVYNDGDQVDKPKGWSIHIPGTDNYVPVRATSLELPIAMAGTAYTMASDIANGNAREWNYYAGMITGSLPYIDQFNNVTGAVDSFNNRGDQNGDGGYAAKNYAVQTIKSFVPGSNNGIQPYVAGKEGESLNAKTVYDKNFGTWLMNAVRKNYDPNFYNGLKDSRDNAGRVRTVDNQGVVSNKHINDANTAEFNTRITDLVTYGREAGLGKNTQDMFNTYDTGKNNNFKTVQDSITFLDVPDGGKPDNAKKLEKNAKLTNLSQQMRDGFFGDTGSELLTLDGKNLYSDVSVPNGAGSKNSRLPISMQSIKNAVAQTDLSVDQRNRIKEISDQDAALYAQLKAKNITYDQYTAERAKTGAEYVDILTSSKNFQRMQDLFDELDQTGFFEPDGLGSTKSGQTYLWNSLNALLGSKGATPAANYPDNNKFTPWGNRGTGRTANSGANNDGLEGLKWTPVGRREMATVKSAKFTPFKARVTLGNEIKKDRSQNYSDRSF